MGIALAKHNGHGSLSDKIKEVAGAASDLRMSGGDVAVMSSAGSGNHGIVAVIPVAMTARGAWRGRPQAGRSAGPQPSGVRLHQGLYRTPDPTCGCAVAAGAGAAAGIVRLHGGTPRQAELAAITLVGTLLGMICDGAKESCGLKVSNAASEAWSAAMLALENRGIRNTQGIISPDIHELGITPAGIQREDFQRRGFRHDRIDDPPEQECGKPRLIPAPRKPGRLQPGIPKAADRKRSVAFCGGAGGGERFSASRE
ncbi:MAG: L-serine ammonia-lyase, iron-sulfur-dependent, subunit alpha [Bilophila wadsworthia]